MTIINGLILANLGMLLPSHWSLSSGAAAATTPADATDAISTLVSFRLRPRRPNSIQPTTPISTSDVPKYLSPVSGLTGPVGNGQWAVGS